MSVSAYANGGTLTKSGHKVVTMRDAKRFLIVFSVFVAVMSGGTPISLGWMFHRAGKDVVIFGNWSVDDGFLFSTVFLVTLVVSLANTLVLIIGGGKPKLRWTFFFIMSLVSSLLAIADFFWLTFLLVALMALTGIYLAKEDKLSHDMRDWRAI